MLKFKMNANLQYAYKFFGQGITVHIYAYPNFILEFFLGLLLVGVYIFLSYEVSRIYRETCKLRPNTLHLKTSLKGGESDSDDSICTSVTRVRHEYHKFDYLQKNAGITAVTKKSKRTTGHVPSSELNFFSSRGVFEPIYEDKVTADRLAALTPAQFVKLDKKRQLRERQIHGCINSLTTLYDNVVAKKYPDTILKEQIESAKEDAGCTRVSEKVMKYLDSESVTESLINVLNDIVKDTTLENPSPIKGDYTSIAYDIGNLKEQSEMIYDTKCDLVDSASNSSKFDTSTDRDDDYCR